MYDWETVNNRALIPSVYIPINSSIAFTYICIHYNTDTLHWIAVRPHTREMAQKLLDQISIIATAPLSSDVRIFSGCSLIWEIRVYCRNHTNATYVILHVLTTNTLMFSPKNYSGQCRWSSSFYYPSPSLLECVKHKFNWQLEKADTYF